jgi:hypothetical protein
MAGRSTASANGSGAVDAQHSNGATSVNGAGSTSATASRNP